MLVEDEFLPISRERESLLKTGGQRAPAAAQILSAGQRSAGASKLIGNWASSRGISSLATIQVW